MFANDAYALIPYTAHYALGFIALASIAGALFSRKGSTAHVWSGRVFVVGMLIAAATAYYFVTVQFAVPPLFDATLMLVAAGSAVLALQSGSTWVRISETVLMVVALLAALALGAAAVRFIIDGSFGAIPASIHCAIFATFVIGDIRYRSPAARSNRRVRRHLYRMSWAVAIGIYAPLFTFSDVLGLSNAAVYLGSMALAPLMLLTFWKTATRLDEARV